MMKDQRKWTITREDFLTREEVARLMDHCSKAAEVALREGRWLPVRDWALIHTGLGAGLRASEIAELRVSDLHLEGEAPYILVRQGKGGKMRTIDIFPPLPDHLRRFLRWKREIGEPTGPDDLVFSSSRGRKLARHTVNYTFKKIALRVGIPERKAHWHVLRHTFATMLYARSGHNLRYVQRQLGHSQVTTTSVYADVLTDEIRKEIGEFV